MKCVVFVAVALALVSSARAFDAEAEADADMEVDAPTVKPRVMKRKEWMSLKSVVIVPKGDPRARPPSDAAIVAPPAGDNSKTWQSPVVELRPTLQLGAGSYCTNAASNIRASASTSGRVLLTTTVGEAVRVTGTSETSANGYVWVPVAARGQNGFIAKSLLGSCTTPAPSTSRAFPLYKQCGASWSGAQLGSCAGTSVCKAGCAMSSVAMILKSRGYDTDPGRLNAWLKANGGYSGCAIYWGSVDRLGKTKCQGFQTGSFATVCGWVRSGYGVVLNVNNGGHWVLATGCDGSNNVMVNDPGYSKVSYPFSQVGRMVLYK